MKKLSKLLLALSFVLSVTTSSYAVTVASWGGAYTESQKLGYGDPTAKKLGIEINWVAPDGTPASEDFFTGMPSKCAVGNILYSWNYAYNTENVLSLIHI